MFERLSKQKSQYERGRNEIGVSARRAEEEQNESLGDIASKEWTREARKLKPYAYSYK